MKEKSTQHPATSQKEALLWPAAGCRRLFSLFRLVAGCCLLFSLASPLLSGCATVAALLPHVIAAVVDGGAILDAIERFVARFFAEQPDPAAQAKVDVAIQKARRALSLVLRTAEAADKPDPARLDAALQEFKQAYLELLALVRPYGVMVEGEPAPLSSSANANGKRLIVPTPLAVSATYRR